MSNRLHLALVCSLDPRLSLSSDKQLIIPQEADPHNVLPHRLAKDIDPMLYPFMVLPTSHWNTFQQAMDRNGMREVIRKAGAVCFEVPKGNIYVKDENGKWR